MFTEYLMSYVSKLQYDTCCEADQTSGSNKGGQRSQRPRWTPAVRTINQLATAATNSQTILHVYTISITMEHS